MSNCDFGTFPCGLLGQVWYLIVLIPDLRCLSYFDTNAYKQQASQNEKVVVSGHGCHTAIKALRQSRHRVWGLTHRRAIKEGTTAINCDWV